MKTLKIFSTIAFILFFSVSLFAQGPSVTKESFKVWGNCGMCKKNIETAAKAAGATYANWDKESKMMTVKYASSKTSGKDIQAKIAAKGYDTELLKGDDAAYNELDPCCQYDRKQDAASKVTCGMECCAKAGCCKADDKCCADKSCMKEGGCCAKDDAKCKEACKDAKGDCCKKDASKKS